MVGCRTSVDTNARARRQVQPQEPRRVAVEHVSPDVDAASFPVKRVVGDQVVVEADVFSDGHHLVAASVEYRHRDDADWRTAPMTALINDRFRGVFPVERAGEYEFRVVGWVDELATWYDRFLRKVDASQDVSLDREEGARVLEETAKRAPERDAEQLSAFAARVRRSADKRTIA